MSYEVIPQEGALLTYSGDDNKVKIQGWHIKCNGLPKPSDEKFVQLVLDYIAKKIEGAADAKGFIPGVFD